MSIDQRPALRDADTDALSKASIRQILQLVDRLAEVAQANLPPQTKLEFLCTLIGTARVLSEQCRDDCGPVESP